MATTPNSLKDGVAPVFVKLKVALTKGAPVVVAETVFVFADVDVNAIMILQVTNYKIIVYTVYMQIKSEIAANVWKILISVGDSVSPGQELIILESMKMEIPVESPIAGVVKMILTQEGLAVDDGQVLLEIE